MPRGRKKKFKLNLNIKPETMRSLLALVLVLFSVVSLISFFAPDYSLNTRIQHMLKSYLGSFSFFLPFLTALASLLLIPSLKLKVKEPRILGGLALLLLSMASMFHLFYGENAYTMAKKGFGGGLIGYKISSLLASTVSIYGAFFVLLALIIISGILVFNISLDQIVTFVSAQFAALKEKFHEIKVPRLAKAASNVVISSGMDPVALGEDSLDAYKESGKDAKDKKSKKQASFEIIPSLSEPQDGKPLEPNLGKSISTSKAAVSAPSLPYTDKVWETPPVDLLMDAPPVILDKADINEKAKTIKDTLKSFGINVEIADIQTGPAVTQYALEAETGTKISKIASLQYDIAMALSSPTGSVRIEAPIPGKSLIGIEVPNNSRAVVSFKSLMTSDQMKVAKSKLSIVLGKDVGNQARVYDISKMPHLLVAGATGSGKSVFLHSLIFSMLYRASPQEVKFIMMDPKRTELIHYNDIPHLLTPVIVDVENAPSAFKWAVNEMERRYKLFEAARARNIDAYNEMSGFQALPYVVIVVDELAEIMIVDPAAVEKSIIRIAQLARATGIHLILAVQRPSTNIITGLIKANIPARIAFNVASQVDSRVIIDQPGAEKLLGKGDMLFIPPDVPKPMRLQGAFVTDKEITNLVDYLKSQGVPPEYKEDIFDTADKSVGGRGVEFGESSDPLLDEAADIVISYGKASTSYLQRRLSIGYSRAARLMDMLEERRIIGPGSGAKPREVLVKSMDDLKNIPDTIEPTESEPEKDNLPSPSF